MKWRDHVRDKDEMDKGGDYLLLRVAHRWARPVDEKPSPELARDMAQPRPEIIEPGNAWIAFLGFDRA